MCAVLIAKDAFWEQGFGPLLEDAAGVPFVDIQTLEKALATRKSVAFIVEPLAAEAGIRIPSREYLQSAQELCNKNGSWLVLDELQTGRYRTGAFLAGHQFDLQPDMVVLARALSGGLMPVGADDG